jgi:hypothetical protein
MKINQSMKTTFSGTQQKKQMKQQKSKFLAITAFATVAIAGSAHAAITVTGGTFESPDIGTLAQINAIPNWFSNTVQYADWHNSSGYTSNGTQSVVLQNQGGAIGYIYQSLGTLDAGTISLDWSFDQVSYWIGANLQIPGTGDVRFFYGTGAGADGTDIDTLGLTQIGSTVNIPLVVPSGTEQFRSGSVDVSSLSAGSTIWMDFTQTSGFFVIDNVSVTAVGVPEPTTTALLGLGGLALILRRRK